MSTVGPDHMLEVAGRLPEGVELVDAPVLGGVANAVDGTLQIFVGGSEASFARCRDLLAPMGTPIHLGPTGAGAAMKLVANSTLAGLMSLVGEALALADGFGLWGAVRPWGGGRGEHVADVELPVVVTLAGVAPGDGRATTRRRSDATTPTLAGKTGAEPVMGQLADRILALHGWVVLVVVFAVPALESSAFVGFVFPGEIAVLLGGVLASERRAPLAGVLAAAIAGAIIGDSVGYAVGERWGRRILDGSVGRLVKREHLDRAERYLAERGGTAVFFGRFTAALRVLIPGLAGMARLRYRTFLLYNAAGGALWATGFVLLGYAAGTSWRRVEQLAKRASLILLVVLAGAVVLAVAARWAARHPERLRTAADRVFAVPPVARLRARYRHQLAFLARRLRPGGALGLALTVGIVALAGAGWAFGAVVQDVVARDELGLVDGPAARFFTAHREAWLTSTMRAVTILGDPAVLIGVVLLAGLVGLRRTRSPRPFTLLAEAYLGAFVLRGAVAVLTRRPGPPTAHALTHAYGYSFPSAHATLAAAVYGMLTALAASSPAWRRTVLLWTGATVLVALVGLSRLELGTEWLTDVLGGLALGTAWLFGLLTATRTVSELHTGTTTPLLPVAGTTEPLARPDSVPPATPREQPPGRDG